MIAIIVKNVYVSQEIIFSVLILGLKENSSLPKMSWKGPDTGKKTISMQNLAVSKFVNIPLKISSFQIQGKAHKLTRRPFPPWNWHVFYDLATFELKE